MQPDFTTLKPVENQPDFATLKPAYSPDEQNTKNILDGFLNIIKKFPGQKLGTAIGESVYNLTEAGKAIARGEGITGANMALDPQNTTVKPKELIGDVINSAVTPASIAINPAKTVLGKVAQFGAIGAVNKGAKALSEDKSATEVLSETLSGAKTGAITGGVLGVAEKGLSKLSDLISKTGDKIQTSVIKPSQADIKDGFSIETIKKYNLGGSLKSSFEKTDKTLDKLSKQLNEKLQSSSASVDLNKVYENTAKRLLGNKLESFGSNSQMESAIEKLRNEIVTISGQNGLVSIPEAQLVKRASGHFGAWQFGVPTPEASASQKVYSTFYNELKTTIEKNSPEGIKELNQEISKLIPIMNALIRRIPVAERNSALSLTDIISLSSSFLEPRALALSLLNFASKSGTVGSALSKMPNLGKGVERTIEPAAKALIAE